MYHTTYNSNYIHVGETLHLYSKTWLFIFVVWQIISNLCSWASTSKRLVYIPSWKSIFCMQSIPNQFLPLQEAHRAALNPSESRWNSASTSSRCQTPWIGSCQHWNIFTANFPYSFFFPGLLPLLAIFLFFGAFLPLNMKGQILPLEQIHSRGCLP